MERIELDHRDVGASAFALIDPLAGDEAGLAAWGEFAQHALAPHGFEAQAAQFPVLIALRDLSSDALGRVLESLLGSLQMSSPCVALLQTSADAGRVAMHLRQRLAPRFPQGRRGVFRFHDPVVFEHLTWILTEQERVRLLGPIDRWLLPLRGAWYGVINPGDAMQRSQPFRLPRAWSSILRIGAIHAVLAEDTAWQAAPSKWGARANQLLARAEQHQLTDRNDAVAFAVQGLRWHARLDDHPRIKQMLVDCVNHPARYRRFSGGLRDADWQAIAAELDAAMQHANPQTSVNRFTQGSCP